MGSSGGARNAPLTPAMQAKRKHWDDETAAGRPPSDTVSRCEAFGMPRVMGMIPLEFIATPRQFTVISELFHEVRRIYLDGRPHPRDFENSFAGHSTGVWEGDTLVVDTVGLVDSDGGNSWLSNQAHIIERIRMVNPDAIVNEITVRDPVALTGEWKFSRTYARNPPGTEIVEYVCTNNRNAPGPGGVQLAEPKPLTR
jgi:hypothetical protein